MANAMDGSCLVRAEWPPGQGGVDTSRRWVILSMLGRGSVWGSRLVRMTK